jgi:hypothetical protein
MIEINELKNKVSFGWTTYTNAYSIMVDNKRAYVISSYTQ